MEDQGCNLTSEVKKYTNGMKTIFLKYGPKLSLVTPNPPAISRSKPCRGIVANLIRVDTNMRLLGSLATELQQNML